jgi:hypothetical protein
MDELKEKNTVANKIAEKYQTKEVNTFVPTKLDSMWTSLVIGIDFTLTFICCVPYWIADNFNGHKKGWR